VSELEVVVPAAGELCEGPVWDDTTGRLYFVDILAGLVHSVDPGTGWREQWNLGVPVGAVAPRRGGGWIAALERGFQLFDTDWRPAGPLVPAPGQPPGTRFNDGYCDPAGRFWAGTLSYAATPDICALYRMEADGTVAEVVPGVDLSNGLAWSPAGDRLYYVDTAKGIVDRMRFDPERGTVAGRETLVAVPAGQGVPDGLTVDREGYLWVAFWDGGCVRRYSPGGDLDQVLHLPVDRVTSVAFGGADLGDLYITTAWEGLSEQQRDRQPLAGSVFRCRPGVAGLPTPRFAG
jgi:sugar lactone lactonase YvrE